MNITLQCALSWPAARLVCGDIDKSAVERALSNVEALNAKRQKKNMYIFVLFTFINCCFVRGIDNSFSATLD